MHTSPRPTLLSPTSIRSKVYKEQGKLQGALAQQKSLDMQLRVLGREHLGVAACYHDIGNVYSAQGKNEVALVE